MNRGRCKNGALEDMSHKAFNDIRRMLYHKELVPGQKIVYRELKEKLSMSPTPIIQALKWLEIQGFAYHSPNRGYYIAPCSLEELEELFDIRQLLEPSLVPAVVALGRVCALRKVSAWGVGWILVSRSGLVAIESEPWLIQPVAWPVSASSSA